MTPGSIQQFQNETLVGGAALDDDGGLGQSPTQPGQRVGPGRPVGDDLGDHRVEIGRDEVTGAETGVHPDARPGRQIQQLDPARRGGEIPVRVLGVQPGLDRVAELSGRSPSSFPPAATCN